jgi:hypothetical protein
MENQKMSDIKTATVTAIIGSVTEGIGKTSGKPYRFQSMTVLQKSGNHNRRHWLREADPVLDAGTYEFDVVFANGKDGKDVTYFNNPVQVS